MQMSLVVAISALVGLASAGLVWFGTGLVQRMQLGLAHWRHARKLKAAEKAAAAAAAAADATKEARGGRR